MESNSSRIQLLANQLAGRKEGAQPVLSSLDFCFFDDLLTPDEVKLRKEVREFGEREVSPIANEYYEKAQLPEDLILKIGQQRWTKLFAKKPYGDGGNPMSLALIVMELARADPSIASFTLIQAGLVIYTVESFASEEQKKKLLPGMLDFKIVSGWGLTEPLIGSDASNLTTSARKAQGGYVLNGGKRWIGSANRDMHLCWARNEETKKIECFFVPIGTPGVEIEVIKNKLALRTVQNCHITYKDAFIPDENRLPGADKGFGSTNQVLEHSRVFVAWVAVGIALGVYDNTIKYVNNRTQFGVKISSFQLQQEKLARMMGHIQAMLLMVWRTTRLYEAGKLTIAKAAMTKAWTTKICREVAHLGREMMGGNGIIIDNYAMKAVADIETVYTYEGTYDINSLVCARELTGIPAFK